MRHGRLLEKSVFKNTIANKEKQVPSGLGMLTF